MISKRLLLVLPLVSLGCHTASGGERDFGDAWALVEPAMTTAMAAHPPRVNLIGSSLIGSGLNGSGRDEMLRVPQLEPARTLERTQLRRPPSGEALSTDDRIGDWQQKEDNKSSADEAAKQLSDPTASIGKMTLNYDYVTYDGNLPDAGNQHSNTLLFQPSLPYALGDSKRLFFRPAVPILFDSPFPTATGFDDEGLQLGDIGYDLSYGGSAGSVIYLVGAAGTIPTATDDSVGTSQWSLGPEVLVGTVQKWGVAGLLLSHRWDVASTSSNAADVNVTGGQYFYAFFLGDGWVLGAGPTFSYNHEVPSGSALTLPLGIGINRTVQLGGRSWKFNFEVWNYLESPDPFGPEWQFRFTVSPVVGLPW